ncbi:hypothetical protein ACR6C2_00315 [Streptomyces sp. INA 01156]
MRATFTHDQLDIEKTVRTLAQRESKRARDALAGPWSAPECDTTLLRDFGLLGVPDSAGGIGSSLIDLLVAVEVLGEHLVPSRFPSHAAAVQLATALGPLPDDVLEGRRILTPAADAPEHRDGRTAPAAQGPSARWFGMPTTPTESRHWVPRASGSPTRPASPLASRSIRRCRWRT